MRSREVINEELKSGARDALRLMVELLLDSRDLLLENSKIHSIEEVKVEEPVKKRVTKKKVKKK